MCNSNFRSVFTQLIVGTVKNIIKQMCITFLYFYTDISLSEKRINNLV